MSLRADYLYALWTCLVWGEGRGNVVGQKVVQALCKHTRHAYNTVS